MTAFSKKKMDSIQKTIRKIEAEERAMPRKMVTLETSALPLGFQSVYSDILTGPIPFLPTIDRTFQKHKPKSWGLFRRYLHQLIVAQRKADIEENPRVLQAIDHIDRKLKRVGG